MTVHSCLESEELRRLGRRLCRALSFPADGGEDEGVPNGLFVEEPVLLWNGRVAEGPAGMAIEDDIVCAMLRLLEYLDRDKQATQDETRGIVCVTRGWPSRKRQRREGR